MSIHNATPEKSARLRDVLNTLISHGNNGATTIELSKAANDMAAHTTVSELRACGYVIDCIYDHMTDDRRKVYRYYYRYKMVSEKTGQLAFTY